MIKLMILLLELVYRTGSNMTDRIHAITVVLDEDMREDDVESLCSAIRHLRHVIAVEKRVSDPESYMAITRARHELKMKLLNIFKDD